MEVDLPFLLCFTLYLRAIFQVQAPWGLYFEGRFNGGFFALPVSGAYIWRGLYMEGLIFGILRYSPHKESMYVVCLVSEVKGFWVDKSDV